MTTSTNQKYTPEEVKQILKDYRWMLNTVKAMRENLEETDGVAIAQYGIEAAMPKRKGCTDDVVFGEVVRRSRQWERIEAYEERIRFVQQNLDKVQGEREMTILNEYLNGHSMNEISRKILVSHTQVRRILEKVIQQLLN